MELYQLNSITTDKGVISDAGINEIQVFIKTQYLDRGEWKALNPDLQVTVLPSLPTSWDWRWMVETGFYRGNFPKRARKYWYRYGIKCPDTFIQVLGEIASRYTSNGTTYQFEFVDKFDWKAGDFGDRGSCYWGGYAAARYILQENGGLAIRFYNEQGQGYARAWIVEEGSVYYLFNGYGLETHVIARIFSKFLNMTYKKIQLTAYGDVFINGDTGYVIGTEAAIKDIDDHTFDFDSDYALCQRCGEVIHYDDVYRGADDYDYCSDCFYELFDSCYWCGEPMELGTGHVVEGDIWCDYCKRNRRR